MSFFSELLGFKGAGRQLNHVEPVVKHLPITPEDLEAMNPALAAFYKEHLATQPTEIGVRIRNSFEPVGDHSKELAFYRWTLHVDFDNQAQEQHISAVIFDLHPTFNPPSVRIEKPGPWSFTRVGWGEFKIGITLVDRFSNTHTFAHDLTLSNPNNEHAHSFFITPPASSTSSSGAATSSTSSSSSSTSSSAKVPKMKGVPESEMHGFLGVDKGWAAPNLVTFCDEEARPGYASRKAHEYNEDPDVLRAKVRLLADLLRRSKHCVCYTGAGISTSAGIDDYASKSKESIATGSRAARPRARRGLAAEPSFAHHTLTALHRAGHLQHWVQQNHDGLPQKAGFPQEAINEIHGAWFDPSNPVVPMSGSLRGDLMAWLLREEQAADLVLAMGTSLCGMNADRMVKTPGKKALRGKGLGSVIVGIQQTQLDNLASLRIFARIDEVMLLLAIEMQLDVRTRIYTPTVAKERISTRPYVYLVPYHPSTGLPSKKLHPWDLSPGAALQLTGGPGAGFCGSVRSVPKTAEDHFTLCFPNTREGPELGKGFQLYALGSWWIEACTQGRVPQLPVINVLADSDQID